MILKVYVMKSDEGISSFPTFAVSNEDLENYIQHCQEAKIFSVSGGFTFYHIADYDTRTCLFDKVDEKALNFELDEKGKAILDIVKELE